jgi:hypothetical protein
MQFLIMGSLRAALFLFSAASTVVSVKVNGETTNQTFLVGNQKFKIAKQWKLLYSVALLSPTHLIKWGGGSALMGIWPDN